MDTRSGGCVPGLPVKLGLLGEDMPALPGDTLTVLADCAPWLTAERPAAAVSLCPRRDGERLSRLRTLWEANALSRVRVIVPDVSCCAGLAEQAERILPGVCVERVLLPVSEEEPEPEPVPAAADVSPIREETAPAPVASLRFYLVSAFSSPPEQGCAAALARRFPADPAMTAAAAALGRETAFLRPEQDGTISVRAFSAAGERQPGPETILAAAGMLRDRERQLCPGTYNIRTRAGFVQINVGEELAWIEHAAGPLRRMLDEGERAALYAALGLADGETEIRPCLAGEGIVLLELPDGADLSAASPGDGFARRLEELELSGLCLYHRGGGEETACFRAFGDLPPGKGAALLGWWLPMLRRAGAECRFRAEGREYRTFTGPDGRLFLGGRVSSGETPIRGDTWM